jgi:Na+-transporting NADH:ubiquinone oxidoreductase subunit B
VNQLRNSLDRLRPSFSKNGQFEKYSAIYEMVDNLIYTPSTITKTAPHVRDGIDLKRVMTFIVLAILPCIFVGVWNIGYQANTAMTELITDSVPGWRGDILEFLGVNYNPDSIWDDMWHGLVYVIPVFVVALVVGGAWEILFAIIRKRNMSEGILAISLLFTLTLPPSIPLWQVAIGISFGVVIGKEVFGGTGKNFINPVLAGRAFLYFAYPAQIAGDSVWTAVDGFSGATPLGLGSVGGIDNITATGITWSQAFFGQIQGAIGETSTLACLLGGVFLVYTGIASWRIITGGFIGMVLTAILFNLIGSDTNPMFSIPWFWHMVLGGFVFGIIFLATDPVTSAHTNIGRWLYGILIGILIVVIRIANPTIPECTMFAILLANIFAPLIDYFVIQINIIRRRQRYAQRQF